MNTNPYDGSQPTVVLVHGAFADASSWNEVVERLQAEGIRVTAPANPLRGISIDSAYINSVLDQVPGPVLAVGHSYGGASSPTPPQMPTTSSDWSTSPPSPRTKASA
jgi:pimeloyl-ACP methyl ester carboxylesterase